MKQFGVFDTGRPCSSEGFPWVGAGDGYGQHLYPTFEEALTYAKAWLSYRNRTLPYEYILWDSIPDDWDGKPFDYNGYGSKIEIREI